MRETPPENLTQATTDEVEFALSFALRFDGRKAFKRADEAMSRIVASHLVEHLRQSGFVIQKKPPRTSHSIGASPDWPACRPAE